MDIQWLKGDKIFQDVVEKLYEALRGKDRKKKRENNVPGE